MEIKSLKLTFQAPVVFEASYEINLEDIEEDNIDTYITNILTEKMSQMADGMYQQVKEDLSWQIWKNISLKEVKKQYKRAGEFDF